MSSARVAARMSSKTAGTRVKGHDRGGGRRKIGKSSFEWVRKMMDGFMVRGCGSPMQWILDLRGCGMEIDFNTTSAGHVN
jgi:hypothetical protein